ncbi:MAG: sigma-E processing peptidase SpoIIGA [Clostridiales bacterium]|nr:sigma-E processing peptidase SpoIIGA [Clostridiales bacterium]
MDYIYIDVLIILNIYVNYFLIKATARITHTGLKTYRCVISSMVGSLFSLMILLPDVGFVVNLVIKMFAAVLIVSIAFGIKDKRQLLKLILFFYGMNFVFAGIMLAMYVIFKPSFMGYNNSSIYIDFSLLTLVICTIIAYATICLIRLILDKGKNDNGKYTVIIKLADKVISIDGLLDTGNSLIDSFSGKPVIICSEKDICRLFSEDISFNAIDYSQICKKMPKGFRLIPFSTISESGIIPVFRPDEVIIREEKTKKIRKVDALIGVNAKQTDAIFNPKLLTI